MYNLKIESNDELKEIDIKNCTCYYLDDIIKIEDVEFGKILLDEKSYEIILIYYINSLQKRCVLGSIK